jgi:hypothetical protein
MILYSYHLGSGLIWDDVSSVKMLLDTFYGGEGFCQSLESPYSRQHNVPLRCFESPSSTYTENKFDLMSKWSRGMPRAQRGDLVPSMRLERAR